MHDISTITRQRTLSIREQADMTLLIFDIGTYCPKNAKSTYCFKEGWIYLNSYEPENLPQKQVL